MVDVNLWTEVFNDNDEIEEMVKLYLKVSIKKDSNRDRIL